MVLIVLAPGAWSQAFGRFGYSELPTVPGLFIDKEGFRAKQPRADKLHFAAKAAAWRPVEVSAMSTTYFLAGKNRSPSKLRVNLLAPGFDLYFANGFSFDLSSLQGPLLTWRDASIGPPNPTPSVPWVIVSFADAQPPLLLSFEGKTSGVRVAGKSGAWKIENATAFQGWVRVALPQGVLAAATHDVAQLGALAKSVSDFETFWNQAPAKVLSLDVREEQASLTAVWTFDKPYAVVPTGALLSNLGGYGPIITSITRRIEAPTEEGPLSYCVDSRLIVRFPIRMIPMGRSVATGKSPTASYTQASPFDIASLVRLGLACLQANCDDVSRSAADGLLSDYLLGAHYEPEPLTGQRLPFDDKGTGLDVAAAQAFLAQALQHSQSVPSEPNSILTSVLWLQDWMSWRLWTADPTIGRRATLIASLAGALSEDPMIRAQAAMLQAGAAAERGLGIWRLERRWDRRTASLIEPLEALRGGLFFLNNGLAKEDAFTDSLLSDLRIAQGPGVVAIQKGETVELGWSHRRNPAVPFVFAAPYPLSIEPGENLKNGASALTLGLTAFSYEPVLKGACKLLIRLPAGSRPLPKASPIPEYLEPSR